MAITSAQVSIWRRHHCLHAHARGFQQDGILRRPGDFRSERRGFELAGAAHIRVVGPDTLFALPQGQRGLFTGGRAVIRVADLNDVEAKA